MKFYKNKKRITANTSNNGYLYVLDHGVGPGTLPKDVHVLNTLDLDDYGYKYKTAVWLNRWLTNDELYKYDIRPETELSSRYGYDLINKLTHMDFNNKVMSSRKTRSRKVYASKENNSYTESFVDNGITYYVKILDFKVKYRDEEGLEAVGPIAKWWSDEDIGYGYMNQGTVDTKYKAFYPYTHNISQEKDCIYIADDYSNSYIETKKSACEHIKDIVVKYVDLSLGGMICRKYKS